MIGRGFEYELVQPQATMAVITTLLLFFTYRPTNDVGTYNILFLQGVKTSSKGDPWTFQIYVSDFKDMYTGLFWDSYYQPTQIKRQDKRAATLVKLFYTVIGLHST